MNELARCINPECVSIFLRSTDREPYDSFCAACLHEIRRNERILTDPQIDDAEFEGDIDRPSNC